MYLLSQPRTQMEGPLQQGRGKQTYRSQEQTHEGKLIRKEITRRKNCGNIWIGPHIKWTIGDEVIETPSTVGTVRIVKGGTNVR